jgi:carboxyl-terminal processing protease
MANGFDGHEIKLAAPDDDQSKHDEVALRLLYATMPPRLTVADAHHVEKAPVGSDIRADKPMSWSEKYTTAVSNISDSYYDENSVKSPEFTQLVKRLGSSIDSEAEYDKKLRATADSLHDPWTTFRSDQDIEKESQRFADGFRPSGIWIKDKNGSVVVDSLLYGFPAYHSDLKIGDKILSINGISVENMPASKVEPLLEGKIGGPNLRLEFETPAITHNGKVIPGERRTLEVPIVAPQEMESTAQIIEDPTTHKHFLKLQLLDFKRSASDQLEEAIKALPKDQLLGKDLNGKDKIAGVILDLRGNEGGDIPPIPRTADMFVPDGPLFIVARRDATKHIRSGGYDEKDYTLDAPTRAFLRQAPLAVITDGATRSAAETLLAALQDRGRITTTVGEKTYGKGVIYDDLDVPGGVLRVTIAKSLTAKHPNGWHAVGLRPDVEVHNARGNNVPDDQLDRTMQILGATKR